MCEDCDYFKNKQKCDISNCPYMQACVEEDLLEEQEEMQKQEEKNNKKDDNKKSSWLLFG